MVDSENFIFILAEVIAASGRGKGYDKNLLSLPDVNH